MAVKNKKRYVVYLTEESAEIVKGFVGRKKQEGGFSGLLDDYVIRMASTLSSAKLSKGEKITFKTILKMVVGGIKNAP